MRILVVGDFHGRIPKKLEKRLLKERTSNGKKEQGLVIFLKKEEIKRGNGEKNKKYYI